MLTIRQIINLENALILELPTFNDEAALEIKGKGWNLPNVWSLVLLKKIYIEITKLPNITREGLYIQVAPWIKHQKNGNFRLIYEYLNALKCFELIDYNKDSFTILKENFFDLKEDELSQFDLGQFSSIFFSYYRFKEISNWFLKRDTINEELLEEISEKAITDNSVSIFCTSFHEITNKEKTKTRQLNDTFFYESNPKYIYQLNIIQDKIMRFFDVYINWGMKIKKIESINLTDGINVKCQLNKERRIKAFYFINDDIHIDIKNIIDTTYTKSTRTISLPELTINIALNFRCSIEKIHQEIISQSYNNNGLYSLQRTSKIFISKDKESKTFARDREKLYPKLGNAFVSHIIVR